MRQLFGRFSFLFFLPNFVFIFSARLVFAPSPHLQVGLTIELLSVAHVITG